MSWPPPLERCRNRLGPEERHLRVMGADRAICGARDQAGAGAGTHSSLLRWTTHRECRLLAEAMGPNEHQLDHASGAKYLATLHQERSIGGQSDRGRDERNGWDLRSVPAEVWRRDEIEESAQPW